MTSREEFEQWYTHGDLKRSPHFPDQYQCFRAHDSWMAWQAGQEAAFRVVYDFVGRDYAHLEPKEALYQHKHKM